MALVLTETKIYSRYTSRNFYKFLWDNLDEADVSPVKINMPSSVKIGMKVVGAFGTGGHVKLQGSLDNVTWYNLKDSAGAEIDLTGAGEAQVLSTQAFCYLRPLVSAGTTVDVDVTLLAIP